MSDASLLDYCNSERQREIVERHLSGEATSAIALELGIDPANARKSLRMVRGRAQKDGFNPALGMLEPYPGGMTFTKATIHRKADGTIIQVWDRMAKEHQDAMLAAVAIAKAYTDKLTPVAPLPPATASEFNADIIPWYNIGDAHFGMLAVESQVGHDFNLEFAVTELKRAMANLIDRTEPCERCVIQDCGDGVHFDNESATTSHSGHQLDASAPIANVAEAYAETMRFIIEYAATRHKHVDVIINQGNHSRVMDLVNAIHFRHLYSNNPAITVLDNTSVYIPYRMGNTFVMTHHSDKCKPGKLADVMQADFSQDWGESVYRYIDIGHIHHGMSLKEHPGVSVESFNQLAPSDKYAHDGGWRSRSFLSCLLRSRTYGEVGRIRVTAEQVKDEIGKLAPGTTAQKRRPVYTV